MQDPRQTPTPRGFAFSPARLLINPQSVWWIGVHNKRPPQILAMRSNLLICGLLSPPSHPLLFPSTPSRKKIVRSFSVKALVLSKNKKKRVRLLRRLLCPHLLLFRLCQPSDKVSAANPPQVGDALSENGLPKVRQSVSVNRLQNSVAQASVSPKPCPPHPPALPLRRMPLF